MIWIVLVTVLGVYADDITETSELSEAKYKLLQPGEDSRIIYLKSGEKMFYEGNLKKSREAFEKVIELDSKEPKAHYYLGLIEYEEGNIEKAKARFQIAHECLGSWVDTLEIPVDAKQVQMEFPDNYEARIYYKDGWYITSKAPLNIRKPFYSLDTGSAYRIKIKSENSASWIFRSIMIGSVIMFSFFLSR